jgi:hypothetical protein
LKTFLEVVVLTVAGLYALYEFNAGYFATDTALEIDTRRASSGGTDVVVVDVGLSRNRRRTELTDLECRLYCQLRPPIPCTFQALDSYPEVNGRERATGPVSHHHHIVTRSSLARGDRITSMAPGDKTRFSCVARDVPRGEICTAELSVVMKKTGSLAFLFGGDDTNTKRATTVSLPPDTTE